MEDKAVRVNPRAKYVPNSLFCHRYFEPRLKIARTTTTIFSRRI